MAENPMRIDPPGCACTNCITGRSRPLDQADREDIRRLAVGAVQDATSVELDFELTVTKPGSGWVFTYRLDQEQAEAALRLSREDAGRIFWPGEQ